MTLELNDKTGCPIRFDFTARDEEEIKKFCKMTKSTHLHLILAIPLKEGVAPFVLQLYGTVNRSKATDVVNRLKMFVFFFEKSMALFQKNFVHIYTLICTLESDWE